MHPRTGCSGRRTDRGGAAPNEADPGAEHLGFCVHCAIFVDDVASPTPGDDVQTSLIQVPAAILLREVLQRFRERFTGWRRPKLNGFQ